MALSRTHSMSSAPQTIQSPVDGHSAVSTLVSRSLSTNRAGWFRRYPASKKFKSPGSHSHSKPQQVSSYLTYRTIPASPPVPPGVLLITSPPLPIASRALSPSYFPTRLNSVTGAVLSCPSHHSEFQQPTLSPSALDDYTLGNPDLTLARRASLLLRRWLTKLRSRFSVILRQVHL